MYTREYCGCRTTTFYQYLHYQSPSEITFRNFQTQLNIILVVSVWDTSMLHIQRLLVSASQTSLTFTCGWLLPVDGKLVLAE